MPPTSATVFALAFAGLAYNLLPHVVLDRITILESATHESSLRFVLVGVIIVVRLIFVYTAFMCCVFRGKLRANLYQH